MTNVVPADLIGMRMNLAGMSDAVKALKCVGPPIGCGQQLTPEQLQSWDDLSLKEYSMSGWCKPCQDKVFKDPDEDDECTHEGDCSVFVFDPDKEDQLCICTCANPCCEVDVGVGVLTCAEKHCRVHGKGSDAGAQ